MVEHEIIITDVYQLVSGIRPGNCVSLYSLPQGSTVKKMWVDEETEKFHLLYTVNNSKLPDFEVTVGNADELKKFGGKTK